MSDRNRALFLLLVVMGVLVSCLSVNNSFESDKAQLAGPVDGSTNFKVVGEIIKAKCVSCHYSHTFVAYTTEAQYVGALLKAGSPNESSIYTRLKGNDSGTTGNMPEGGQLTTDEIKSFKDWIVDFGK